MTHRLLLAGLLLVLAFSVHAAAHGTSGDAGPTCPPATLTEPGDNPATAPEAPAPSAIRPAAPPAGTGTNPVMPKPGLRWHSFLPGMMK